MRTLTGKQYIYGITIIELLIVITLIGLLITLAAPHFHRFIEQSRSDTTIRTIEHNFELARSQAVYKQIAVTYCASSSFTQCDGNWNQGAIVFEDNNGNDSLDANEKLLSKQEATTTGGTINLHASNKFIIRFSANGYSTSLGNFVYCAANQDMQFSKKLVFNKTGRIRLYTKNITTSDCKTNL